MLSKTDENGKKNEIAQAQQKLLKKSEGSRELEKSWLRTFADVSVLEFKECKIIEMR